MYRGYQNWQAHVGRNSSEQIGHLLQIVCRRFLGSHGEGWVEIRECSLWLPCDDVSWPSSECHELVECLRCKSYIIRRKQGRG